MSLELQPITFREAALFVDEHHRHNKAPAGHKFSVAANDGERVVGVAIVGRPVARHFDDGWTLELTRCCTDGTRNAASMLYGAAWRAARAMGYRRLVTYTLPTESGASLRAAGWRVIGTARGGKDSWATRPRRSVEPRRQKLLWEAV